MLSKTKVEEALELSWNMTELAKNLGYKNPGTNTKRKLKKLMDQFKIDYSDLKKTSRPRYKYEKILKSCPVCQNEFETQMGHEREKTTCSHSCSNTYFRSGEDNPNYKNGFSSRYRETAFASKLPECERCNWNIEKGVLEVHHIDRDRSNNDISNLEVLCPNCHDLEHYNSSDGRFH